MYGEFIRIKEKNLQNFSNVWKILNKLWKYGRIYRKTFGNNYKYKP